MEYVPGTVPVGMVMGTDTTLACRGVYVSDQRPAHTRVPNPDQIRTDRPQTHRCVVGRRGEGAEGHALVLDAEEAARRHLERHGLLRGEARERHGAGLAAPELGEGEAADGVLGGGGRGGGRDEHGGEAGGGGGLHEAGDGLCGG